MAAEYLLAHRGDTKNQEKKHAPLTRTQQQLWLCWLDFAQEVR